MFLICRWFIIKRFTLRLDHAAFEAPDVSSQAMCCPAVAFHTTRHLLFCCRSTKFQQSGLASTVGRAALARSPTARSKTSRAKGLPCACSGRILGVSCFPCSWVRAVLGYHRVSTRTHFVMQHEEQAYHGICKALASVGQGHDEHCTPL